MAAAASSTIEEPTPIEQWLDRQRRREQRRVTIADALVGGRWGAYGWFRLRFYSVRLLVRILLHGVNLAVLVRVFDGRGGVQLVAGSFAVLSLGRAAWWGALEGLRERIRLLFADGRGHLADREIRRWLRPATIAGAGLGILVAGGWLVVSIIEGADPAVTYLAVAGLLTAVELPLRCYHSGLAAVRRVFRPLPIVMLVEVLGLALLAALWPLMGEWAAPVASLVAGVAVVVVTIVFSARTYWFIGLDPLARRVRARAGPLGLTRSEVWSAVASAAMSVDAAVLVVLALAGDDLTVVAAAVVVVLPGLAGGVDWAQLFYFDLKRLGATAFGEFRRQAAARIRRLAILVGGGAGVVAALLAWLAVPDLTFGTAAALVPLFVARAVLAAVQVRAFAERSYGRVALATVIVLALSLAVLGIDDEALVVLGLAAACVPGAGLLWRGNDRGPGPGGGQAWPLSEWIPAVAARTGPTLLLVVRVHSHQHPLDPESMALRLTRDQMAALAAAHPHAAVTMLGSREIALAMTPGSPEEWVTRSALVGGAAGLLADLEVIEQPDGSAALADLRARLRTDDRLLAESLLPEHQRGHDPIGVADELFAGLVRRGVTGGPGDGAATAGLRGLDRQDLFSAAVAHARSGLPRAGGRYEATTITDRGAICRFYAIPARAPVSVRRPWRATVLDTWFALALDDAALDDP